MKNLFELCFLERVIVVSIFVKNRPICIIFFSHFPEFLPKIAPISLKYKQTDNDSPVVVIFKDEKMLFTILIYFFGQSFG